MQVLQTFFARLARSCTKLCKCCAKNETFLARSKKSCKNLTRKKCKTIFLQDLIKILQENHLAIFPARFLQDILYFARKASFLVQDLQDMCKI